LRALEAAGTEPIDAAMLKMDRNVEATIAMVDVLVDRALPLVVITTIKEYPSSMKGPGIVMTGYDSRGLGQLIKATMPLELTSRMDLSQTQYPAWLLKYPAEYHKFLFDLGNDEYADPRMDQFNRELIDLSNYCKGKPAFVFKYLFKDLIRHFSPDT